MTFFRLFSMIFSSLNHYFYLFVIFVKIKKIFLKILIFFSILIYEPSKIAVYSINILFDIKCLKMSWN